MTMREYDPPEEEPPDWVHPNAHMVLVGEAAHPFPVSDLIFLYVRSTLFICYPAGLDPN